MDRVPENQGENAIFRKHHVSHLRKIVEPQALRNLVKKAYEEGIHPGTRKYVAWMQLETKSNPAKTEEMIEVVIAYADKRAKEGLKLVGAKTSNVGGDKPVCNKWSMGTCRKGSNCKYKHTGAAGAGAHAAAPSGNQSNGGGGPKPTRRARCRQDEAGQKCPRGQNCPYEHKNHSINPPNKPKPKVKSRPNRTGDKTGCDVCGGQGHIKWRCDKLKKHGAELKNLIGYNGDVRWFTKKENSAKSRDLFKTKGWLCAAPKRVYKDETKVLPFELRDNWLDTGYCWIGHGKHSIRIRMYVDMGSTCSFSTIKLFDKLKVMAKEGTLGAARVANEVAPVEADAFNGAKVKMKKWMQLPVRAENVAGTLTTVVGQYVSFCRKSSENVLVAGRGLARALGYVDPEEQRALARTIGVSEEQVFDEGVKPRTYVLSKETQATIEANRLLAEKRATIVGEGRMFMGSGAWKARETTVYVKEPLLKTSYITTAALNRAGPDSFTNIKGTMPRSEFAANQHGALAAWLGDGQRYCATDEVTQVTRMDVIRVLREMTPMTRIGNVTFRVIRSTENRCVLGRDCMKLLALQDEDMPDPLQSDIDYDEEAEVDNFLEAAFDRAELDGLPRQHEQLYRKLILERFKHVFRLRLGKDKPANFAPMVVKLKRDAVLKPGYKIPFNLSPAEKDQLKKELDVNRAMGVVGKADMYDVLHSLLTVRKPSGGARWVITCITANDITLEFSMPSADNVTDQQKRMKNALYFFVADLVKGYWQIALAKESQHLYCFDTPWGPMKYLRAPMGGIATAPYFDMCMMEMLKGADLYQNGVEMVHDDHTGHSNTIVGPSGGNSHYALLERYLKTVSEHGVCLSPKKFTLFAKEADFGGVLHGHGGIKPNPIRYQAVIDQPDPELVSDVYSGISAIGWSRSFIPNFAVLEHPLRAFVMKQLGAGKKSLNRAKRINLKDCGWTPQLKAAYARLRLALIHSIKRAYRDPDKIPCLIWDASKYAWSYTITQVAPEELAKPWEEQQHEILVTRSGIFKNAETRWDIGCKEAYPPWRAIKKDAQFLHGKFGFVAIGDHRNITHVQVRRKRPASVGPASPRDRHLTHLGVS